MNSEEKRLMFDADASVAFTKPTSLYFNGVKQRKPDSWQELFATVCRLLLSKREDVFDGVHRGKKIGNIRLFCCPDKDRRYIGSGYYLRVGLSAKDIVNGIANILKECGVPQENVIITYRAEGKRKKSRSSNDKDDLWCDFHKEFKQERSSPQSLIYFGSPISFPHSWIGVYITLCKKLLSARPKEFAELRRSSASSPKSVRTVVDKERSVNLRRPERIGENYYVETNLSASAIVKSIKAILDACNIDYKNVEISYRLLPKDEEHKG